MKLPGRGEFQIIDYLRQLSGDAPGLIRGIGDDCSVVRLPAGEDLLTSTDLLTEGIHFDLKWTNPRALGRKAVSVNVSDLAAMGARPRYLYLSLALPDELDAETLDPLLSGVLHACEEYDIVLVGGDTCRSSSGLTVSVSVQGTAPESAWVSRSGARSGDDVYVTGTIGDSALALKMLQAGESPDPFLLGRHIDPTARVAAGVALAGAGVPTAMIDISDGLLGDLEHLLAESATGAEIDLDSLPLSLSFQGAMGDSPDLVELALGGGEDYELLFTAAPGAVDRIGGISERCSVPMTRIGRMSSERENLRLLSGGVDVPLPALRGYKHFPEAP